MAFLEIGRFYDDLRNGKLDPDVLKLLNGKGAIQAKRLLAMFACADTHMLEFGIAVEFYDVPEEDYWTDKKPHLPRIESRSPNDADGGCLQNFGELHFVLDLYETFNDLETVMPGKAAAIVDDLRPFAVAWMQMGRTWGDDARKELEGRIGALLCALVGCWGGIHGAKGAFSEMTRDPASKSAETQPPPNPPVPPSPAETWNGKTVGRLTVEEWGRRILWKPKRKKDAYKTPEPEPYDFTAPRIWAGLALILANGGGWADMEEEQRESGSKTKWKDAFKGERLKRLRDAVFESRAQDAPGTSRGQFWKLRD